MTFEESVELILAVEKGLVTDSGGVTNFGISQRAYPQLNIAALTREDAIEIYRRDYWDKYSVEKLPEVLRFVFFDCAINQGQHFAVTTLQKIVTAPVDGLIGATTLQRLSLFHDLDILEKFSKARLEEYITDKNFSYYGGGWIRRLFDAVFKSIR